MAVSTLRLSRKPHECWDSIVEFCKSLTAVTIINFGTVTTPRRTGIAEAFGSTK